MNAATGFSRRRRVWLWCALGFLFAAALRTQDSGGDPAPLGSTQAARIKMGEGYVTTSETAEAEITVLEIVRGSNAWRLLERADPTNKEPAAGFEYLLARVRFQFGKEGGDDDFAVRNEQFACVSGDGEPYESPAVVQPKPALNGRLYSGEILEGWITFLVAVTDSKPLMTFGYNYERVWFRLYPPVQAP